MAVLGQWTDEVTAPDREVLNLAGSRRPFTVAPREAATERARLPLLVVLGVGVPALLATYVIALSFLGFWPA